MDSYNFLSFKELKMQEIYGLPESYIGHVKSVHDPCSILFLKIFVRWIKIVITAHEMDVMFSNRATSLILSNFPFCGFDLVIPSLSWSLLPFLKILQNEMRMSMKQKSIWKRGKRKVQKKYFWVASQEALVYSL